MKARFRPVLILAVALAAPALAQQSAPGGGGGGNSGEPATPASESKALDTGTTIIAGCEGEGCGCIYADNKAIEATEPFVLYTDMNKKSDKLGSYQKGAKATLLGTFSVVRDNGAYLVTEVKKRSLPVKKGDRLTQVFYLGEGLTQAQNGPVKFTYDQDEVVTKQIKPTVLEIWALVTVGQTTGFAPELLYEGCLD